MINVGDRYKGIEFIGSDIIQVMAGKGDDMASEVRLTCGTASDPLWSKPT